MAINKSGTVPTIRERARPAQQEEEQAIDRLARTIRIKLLGGGLFAASGFVLGLALWNESSLGYLQRIPSPWADPERTLHLRPAGPFLMVWGFLYAIALLAKWIRFKGLLMEHDSALVEFMEGRGDA